MRDLLGDFLNVGLAESSSASDLQSEWTLQELLGSGRETQQP